MYVNHKAEKMLESIALTNLFSVLNLIGEFMQVIIILFVKK